MRRFLLYILALLLPVMVLAQQSRSLEIDAASFKPVNTDPLTGVAIDKIDVDNSLRSCARIKLKINRMTRADIENVQINVMGGIHDVMKKVVAHEGNGLIIELTAKPQTRFYLHHDKYGDSNEVTLNLEGNKEYRLDAELCVLQTIAINTNVAGAEVYIDGVFKGKTDERCICTIGDMTHGVHKVRVVYGAASNEQDIEINGSSVYFRIEVSIASATPQYVVLSVVPQEAVVLIDGKEYTPDKGVVYTLLNSGTYNYSVSAKDYYTDSGSFTVSGAKVIKEITLRPAHGWLKVSGDDELQGARVFVDGTLVGTAPLTTDRLASGEHSVRIVKTFYKPFEGKVVITDGKTLDYTPTLEADFANVQLKVDGDFEIFINNKHMGRGSWSGDLASGTYIFEARKAGHKPTNLSKNIVATPAKQSYVLATPQPILGKLNVTSSPAMADVYVDGKVVGQTPLMVDLVVGKHEVSLRKGELASEKQSVDVLEKQIVDLNITFVGQQGKQDYVQDVHPKEQTQSTSQAVNTEIESVYNRGVELYNQKDYKNAYDIFVGLANSGHAGVQYYIGQYYRLGHHMERDYDVAFEWYRKSAKQGFAKAFNALGIMYGSGQGVDKDNDKAIEWYRKAIEKGEPAAMANMAHKYRKGYGVEKDYYEAVSLYRRAAEQGYSTAQLWLGHMYYEGHGVEQDYYQATVWYRKAAEAGYGQAQRMLGLMYRKGRGVEQDYDEALKWYRRAADAGSAAAQNDIGLMYMNGEGVERNYDVAIYWFKKSAEKNYKYGFWNLGRCYENGWGVKRDEKIAWQYYEKAAEKGHKGAKKKLEEM